MRSRGLIIAGLASMAITEPVLDALRRNESYRHAAELGSPECIALAVLLTFVLTPLAIGVDRLWQRLAGFFGGHGSNLILFVLALLAALACLRPVMSRSLLHYGLAWLAVLLLAIPIAGFIALRIERSALLRRFLAVMAAGVVLFPATFTLQLVKSPVAKGGRQSQRPVFSSPTNVVLVVFDEFTGTSLRSGESEIDSEHFPNFARLARSSTWYTNATSSHARTDKAVPAILGSRVATEDIPPIPENYPNNLFQVLDRSQQFGVTAFEPVSRLCEQPDELEPLNATFSDRVSELVAATATVYPRLILPADTPVALPDAPELWQGIRRRMPQETRRDGRVAYPWCFERDRQLAHFLSTIAPREQPHLWFMHSGLPHFPWCFAADGRPYVDEYKASWPPPSSIGEIGEEWSDDVGETMRCEFRYRQQIGMIDHFIGDLQDRLQGEGLWDSSLVIVMADHGVCFRPGSSRRYPHALNTADLLSIPLFIKYPGQTSGRIDRRNIESIDILPTIADVLGIDRTFAWAGNSALENEQRLRKSFRFEDGEVVTAATLPGVAESVQRQYGAFGRYSLDELPAAAMAWPSLQGRDVSGLAIADVSVGSFSLTNGMVEHDGAIPISPMLVEGTIDRSEIPGDAGCLVAAVNGEVVDSCHIVHRPTGVSEFHMMLPQRMVERRGAVLEVFVAPTANPGDWKRLTKRQLSK